MHVRRLFVKTFSLLLLVAMLLAALPVSLTQAATLDVCTSGCTYTTLAAAIAAASEGDTITVGPGSYDLAGTKLTKSVTIVGAGKDATILKSTGTIIVTTKKVWVQVWIGKSLGLSNLTMDGNGQVIEKGLYGDNLTVDNVRFQNFGKPPNFDAVVWMDGAGVSTITNSTFIGSPAQRMIRMNCGSGTCTATLTGNNFAQAPYAIELFGSRASIVVNAEMNWWGNAAGPASGQIVTSGSAAIDYDPWCLDEYCGMDPHTVWVDDDYTAATPGWGVDRFDVIQDGIAAVTDGGTVNVAAGTYVENVTVGKSLSLLGAGRDTTVIQGVAPLTDAGMFNIAASNVVIDGFGILGVGQKTVRITQPVQNVQFLNNRVVGAENVASAGGWALFESNYNMTQSDLVIHNNIFVGNNASYLVYLNPLLIDLVFTQNTFEGTLTSGGMGVGMDGLDGNQVIAGNTFDFDSSYALFEAFGTFDIVGIFDANTWRAGYMPTANKVAPISTVFPSTNDINRAKTPVQWGHVNVVSVNKTAGTITLEFVSKRGFVSCFEYRTDGDTSQKLPGASFNPEILDGLYPYTCVNNATKTKTFNLNQYIEVRLPFGAEKDERFYWTRFDLLTDVWVCPTGDCGHPGMEFASIQDAIDAAYSGTTIHILAGHYSDIGGNDVYKPGLTIVLEDGVEVENNSPAFIINADYTTITTASLLGAKLVPTAGSNAIDVAAGLKNIVLEGFEIDGSAGTNGIHYAGVVTDTIVSNTYMHSLLGDGIYFAAQPAGTVQIQGNLFKGNGGVGVNNPNGTQDVDATFNAWGAYDGPTAGDGVGSNVAFSPWTHVELSLESSGTVHADQVVKFNQITYTVYADLKNAMGADFTLTFDDASLAHVVANDQIFTVFDLVKPLEFVGNSIHYLGYNVMSPAVSDEHVALFSVTFEAKDLPGASALDFDEDTDGFSMAPGYGPSTNIYASALEDRTVTIIELPTLSSADMVGPYIAGLMQDFHVRLENPTGGAPFSNVLVRFVMEDTDLSDIFSFEYLQGSTWLPLPLSQDGANVVGEFGPSTGFPITAPYDATSSFRIIFMETGSYDFVVSLFDLTATPEWELATLTGTAVVNGEFDVTGTVSMQGRSVRADVPLTLTAIGAPIYGPFDTLSTSVITGNVLFSGVNGGVFEITTLQPRYLNITAALHKQISVAANYLLPDLELRGGNADWTDNVINLSDAGKVGGKYGIGTILDDADVNFDGRVNIQDLALVGGNYDLTSAEAYSSWLP